MRQNHTGLKYKSRFNGKLVCVKILLESKADASIRNSQGGTAEDFAKAGG